MDVRRVCVFCGSSPGARPDYRDAATALAAELTARGLGLVYGGSHLGLMGVIADACLAAGGEVIGVIPDALVEAEIAHTGLDDLRVVASMHERKALMADLADAFIAMPGGFGTVEEFCEVLTWSQLGLHAKPKPCGLLDVAGYYDPLLALFDRAVDEGFIRHQHRQLVVTASNPADMLDRLGAWAPPPPVVKWLDPDQR